MANEIIAAVFDSEPHASEARRAVEAGGIAASAIRQYSQNDPAIQQYLAQGEQTKPAPTETRGFWASLFGDESSAHDHEVFARSLTTGSNVLAITIDAADGPRVTTILENFSPVDVTERAETYGLTNASAPITSASATTTGATAALQGATAPIETGIAPATQAIETTATGAAEGVRDASSPETIALHAEELQVGTRQISGNTTRIRRYTVTTPVEKQVTLHDETVTIERTRPTGETTMTGDAFAEKTIEVTTTTEEPVVAKVVSLAEEIVVHREQTERTETVSDTVRHEEVEVQQIPPATSPTVAPATDAAAVAPIEMKQSNG